MSYLIIPTEVTLDEFKVKHAALSPSMYSGVIYPTGLVKPVRDLLDALRPFDKGNEPGSMWYMKHSTHYLIRTKALNERSYLLYPKGDAIVPINPNVFENPALSEGDILLAKDSNIGECAIVDRDHCENHMFSGGLVRLHPSIDRYYLFSFIKHPLFKDQLRALTAKGSTITHAKDLWLDCLIPFPNQKDADQVINYISILVQVIIEKNKVIRERDAEINRLIGDELAINDKQSLPFCYSYPTLDDIKKQGRLDAAVYDCEYKERMHRIVKYERGTQTPSQMGFVVTPGPSLEIKILGTRIDSHIPKPGFYTLILPTNISEYGTMNSIQYLGTSKNLPLLKQGDIVFGEAGFHKGRSIVLVESFENCTTNAHGLYARRSNVDLVKSAFFRCIFNYYRSLRLIDLAAVGGSGGHLSPSYFDEFILIPNFREDKQEDIASLYCTQAKPAVQLPVIDNFIDWHRQRNVSLGIWELDRDAKALQHTLDYIQKQIIQGRPVIVPS